MGQDGSICIEVGEIGHKIFEILKKLLKDFAVVEKAAHPGMGGNYCASFFQGWQQPPRVTEFISYNIRRMLGSGMDHQDNIMFGHPSVERTESFLSWVNILRWRMDL